MSDMPTYRICLIWILGLIFDFSRYINCIAVPDELSFEIEYILFDVSICANKLLKWEVKNKIEVCENDISE